MKTINVDLNNVCGEIKPLNGVCCAPYSAGMGKKQEYISAYFKDGNIPYCRLHDCGGVYGGGRFVDVTNIFPDFSADENDPESYDFYFTDEYISAIEETGCGTYYRLGVTIEWSSRKTSTVVPPDFEKWAKICEHIIMHYNEGWKDGFSFDIRYWEIWNEPENPGSVYGPCMWQGTKEEFFELYKISSKYLKNRFPYIKIGGYGSCGFYTLTRDNAPESYAEFISYFKDFLAMVKKESCPLDFFSWHIYTGDEKEAVAHAKFVRETLDEYGFNETESHLNEWNVAAEGSGFIEKHTAVGAAFNAALMALMQNSDYVDKAMYYAFGLESRYNGFMNLNDTGITDIPWYTFKAYGRLLELKNAVRVSGSDDGIYAVAATNGTDSAVMLTNYMSEDGRVTLNMTGIGDGKKLKFRLIADNSPFEEVMTLETAEELKISFDMQKNTVIFIEAC